MLNMQGQGKRRSKKRWLDNIREDMKEFNMTEDMAEIESEWCVKIKADPLLHGDLSIDEKVRRIIISSFLLKCSVYDRCGCKKKSNIFNYR